MKSLTSQSRFSRLVRTIAFGVIGITSMFGVAPKSEAAVTYPIVNNQVVRFELNNGVALNLPNSSLVNDKPIWSYTGNQNDVEQHFKVISNGDEYNFQRNNTGFSLSSSTLTPTNGSQMVSYGSGFGGWQDFWLDDSPGNGYYLIKWRKNPNFCVNVPGRANNVRATFWTCNTTDQDMLWRIVNVSGVPNYWNPAQHNDIGYLTSESGRTLSMNTNNSNPTTSIQSDFDENQLIRFIKLINGGYVFQRSNSTWGLSSATLDYEIQNRAGAIATTYTSGEGRWQNFGFIDVGNNYMMIKYMWNPNYCLQASTGSQGSSVTISPCDWQNPHQKWKLTVYKGEYDDYKLHLFSRKPNQVFPVGQTPSLADITNGNVGHSWISFVNYKLRSYEGRTPTGTLNGTRISRKVGGYYTWGKWPGTDVTFNNSTDMSTTSSYFQNYSAYPNANQTLTTKAITYGQFVQYQTRPNTLLFTSPYNIFASNCASFANGLFQSMSGDQFVSWNGSWDNPATLVESINKSGKSGWKF
jgi:hypothetical protein